MIVNTVGDVFDVSHHLDLPNIPGWRWDITTVDYLTGSSNIAIAMLGSCGFFGEYVNRSLVYRGPLYASKHVFFWSRDNERLAIVSLINERPGHDVKAKI